MKHEEAPEIVGGECGGCVFHTDADCERPRKVKESCTDNGTIFIPATPEGRAEYTRLRAAYKLGIITEEELYDDRRERYQHER